MATARPLRTLLSSAPSSLRTGARRPQRCFTSSSTSSACVFSTSTPHRSQDEMTYRSLEAESVIKPRWKETPARMVAPVRIRPRPQGAPFVVNTDPQVLDNVYIAILGPGGDKMLSEEVKWLAVTHKSFDHGRRGFNDRLVYLGRRIISLQTSLALINGPQATLVDPNQEDEYGRKPFTHPALNGLQGLTSEAKHNVLNRARLAGVAKRYGIDLVTRWKPAKADNFQQSGADVVYTASLSAIIGAIALERGGEVANRVVKEKILNPLGLI